MSSHKVPEAHDPIDATVRAPSSWGFDERPRGTPPPIPTRRPLATSYLVAVSPPRRRSLPPPIPHRPPPPRRVVTPHENQHDTASSQAPLIDELAVSWFENTSYTALVRPQPSPRRGVLVAAGAFVAVFVATLLVVRWMIGS